MRRQEIEHILTSLLDAFDENISHLNISVGKPFQAERSGHFIGVEIEPPFYELTPFQTEIFALNLIRQDRSLTEALVSAGTCSLTYDLPGDVRFATDIFLQRNNYAITLRKKDDIGLDELDVDDLHPDSGAETGGKDKGKVLDLDTKIAEAEDIGDDTMDEGDVTQIFNMGFLGKSSQEADADKKLKSPKKKGLGSSLNVFKKLGKLLPGSKSRSKD